MDSLIHQWARDGMSFPQLEERARLKKLNHVRSTISCHVNHRQCKALLIRENPDRAWTFWTWSGLRTPMGSINNIRVLKTESISLNHSAFKPKSLVTVIILLLSSQNGIFRTRIRRYIIGRRRFSSKMILVSWSSAAKSRYHCMGAKHD